MYLIHLHFSPPPEGGDLPSGVEEVLYEVQPAIDLAVRHVREDGAPVLGLYVRAPDLHAAELWAAVAWRAVTRRIAGAAGWTLRKAEAPLLIVDELA
ncbi:hypothetical protein [Streptomyces sp. TBY4]|uniref:hypothetical protein n=1 Tax=Streptomyces sp. TBY4 TaxID=2962030 RepID=UPI0020B8B989|nr:hypothetical protein [Streptomyces sp. TBY4]MCP3759638.1 hypothetical protein [Streptomyces sp. TBY4]